MDVDAHDAGEVLFGGAGNVADQADASIVDEDVEVGNAGKGGGDGSGGSVTSMATALALGSSAARDWAAARLMSAMRTWAPARESSRRWRRRCRWLRR